MRNIKLTLEYEGTNYAGWQIQPEGIKTVQGVINEALRGLLGEDIKLKGASRTDAGVHALKQVAAFRTKSNIPVIGLKRALNSILPDDIVVTDAEHVSLDFDPRHDAKSKVYLYRILNRAYPTAINRRFSWFIHRPLDTGLMKEGAKFLCGKKDFTSFKAADSDSFNSTREISFLDIKRDMDYVVVLVRGNAFLRHMVRIMVGTLVELGMHRLELNDIHKILEARDRSKAGRTAPARGLFLKGVDY